MSRLTVVRRLRDLFENVTGTRIFRDLPGGVDLGHDIRRYLPNLEVSVVFDVGANVGQSTSSYVKWFPRARIFAFEPAPGPFARVSELFRQNPRVEVHDIAMSSAVGTGRLFLQGRNDAGSSLDPSVVVGDRPSHTVPLSTIDTFCDTHAVDRIQFLKIDTEGHDLDVLRGAAERLRSQRIDLVQVEAGMNRDNHTHVPFEDFKRHLEEYGYSLFRMYEQVSERALGMSHLRRTNLVFCSERTIAANYRERRK